MILSLLALAFASLFNALMDVSMFNFENSILKSKNNIWNDWWKDRTHKFWILQLNDGWHFCKMFMIGFVVISVVLYEPIIRIPDYLFLSLLIDFAIYSAVWIVAFNLFYDKILQRKKPNEDN